MEICVFSDSHLGITNANVIIRDGVNVRERDIYNSFNFCIDHIINAQPDIVIHAGDLFDSIRPVNKALHCAVSGIDRILTETNATVILCGGNHCLPRMPGITHVFDVLRSSLVHGANRFYAVHNAGFTYQVGALDIHVIPYAFTDEILSSYIADLVIDESREHVVVAHGQLLGMSMHSAMDAITSDKFYHLTDSAKLAIVGHNHTPSMRRDNTIVPGSTDIFGWDEVSQKYIWDVHHNGGVSRTEIPTRSFITIEYDYDPFVDVYDYVSEKVLAAGEAHVGNICRVILNNMPAQQLMLVDKKRISQLVTGALYTTVKTNVVADAVVSASQAVYKTKNIAEAWDVWAEGQDEDIRAAGKERLAKMMEVLL